MCLRWWHKPIGPRLSRLVPYCISANQYECVFVVVATAGGVFSSLSSLCFVGIAAVLMLLFKQHTHTILICMKFIAARVTVFLMQHSYLFLSLTHLLPTAFCRSLFAIFKCCYYLSSSRCSSKKQYSVGCRHSNSLDGGGGGGGNCNGDSNCTIESIKFAVKSNRLRNMCGVCMCMHVILSA